MVLNNYWRKFSTYKTIGWDEDSIHEYLSHKDKIMQIASFNTPQVNFSASSRRNRFYTIYNQVDMLDQDVPWDYSVEAIRKISASYKIFIISNRNLDLKEKTLEILTRLGYPMNKITLFFKKSTANLFTYRKKCWDEITELFPTGVGVILNPSELDVLKRFQYTPIVFTSIKNAEDFNNSINIICNTWQQLCSSLQCD
jgi:hypothetical protein